MRTSGVVGAAVVVLAVIEHDLEQPVGAQRQIFARAAAACGCRIRYVFR